MKAAVGRGAASGGMAVMPAPVTRERLGGAADDHGEDLQEAGGHGEHICWA